MVRTVQRAFRRRQWIKLFKAFTHTYCLQQKIAGLKELALFRQVQLHAVARVQQWWQFKFMEKRKYSIRKNCQTLQNYIKAKLCQQRSQLWLRRVRQVQKAYRIYAALKYIRNKIFAKKLLNVSPSDAAPATQPRKAPRAVWRRGLSAAADCLPPALTRRSIQVNRIRQVLAGDRESARGHDLAVLQRVSNSPERLVWFSCSGLSFASAASADVGVLSAWA